MIIGSAFAGLLLAGVGAQILVPDGGLVVAVALSAATLLAAAALRYRPGLVATHPACAKPDVMQAILPLSGRTPGDPLAAAGAPLVRWLGFSDPLPLLQGLIHPDDRRGVLRGLREAVEGHACAPVTHRFRDHQGAWRTLSWAVLPDARTGEWRAVVQDLTELRRREAALERERELVEGHGGALVAIDAQGVVTRWSRGAERLLGFAEARLLGRPLEEVVEAGERCALRDWLGPGGAAEAGEGMVVRLRHRFGGSVGVYLTLTRGPGGRGVRVLYAVALSRLGNASRLLGLDGERYRSLVENALDLIFTLSLDGRIVALNPAFETTTGWGREDWLGRPLDQLLHPDDAPIAADAFAALVAGRAPGGIEVRLRSAFGSWLTVEVIASALHEGDRVVAAFGIARDVTERRRAEEALEESEARFGAVVEYAADPILVHDVKGRLIDVNPAACEHLGYSRDELLALNIADIDVGDDGLERIWPKLTPGATVTLETEYLCRDGWRFPVEVRMGTIDLAGNRHLLLFARDITERKQAEKRLDHLAHHDALTGLPNRLLLRDRLEQALVKARRNAGHVAVCFLDLDRFKQVNDTLGHDVGDEVLRESARRLREVVREGDTVARLGGDEFVIVLEAVSGMEDALLVAEKVLERFAEPMEIGGRTLRVGTSIGLSLFPDDADDAETLLRHADAAMYLAKRAGPNHLHCFSRSRGNGPQEELGLD